MAAYELIDEVELSSSALQVDFTSIPSTYKNLVLTIFINGATADYPYTQVRFNGDSSSVYSWQRFGGTSGVSSGYNHNDSTFNFTYFNPSAAQVHGGILTIGDYSNTSRWTRINYQQGNPAYSAEIIEGNWGSTTTVNAIRIYSWSPQYNSGSVFRLWGVNN